MPNPLGQSSKTAPESMANKQFRAQQAVAMVMLEASYGRQMTTVSKWEFFGLF
jgi:hypothetical protein